MLESARNISNGPEHLLAAGSYAVLCAVVAITATACSSPHDPREIQGSPPVDRVVEYGDSLAVHPVEGVHIADFVDLGLFGGFRPGMSPEEAREHFGPPDRIEGSAPLYELPSGRLLVSVRGRNSDLPQSMRFYLRLMPTNTELDDLFHRTIVSQLPRRNLRTVVGSLFWGTGTGVGLIGYDRRTVLMAILKNGRVWAVEWYEDEL